MVKATVQPKIQHILSLLHNLCLREPVMEVSAEERLFSLQRKIIRFIFAPDAETFCHLFVEVTIQFLRRASDLQTSSQL